MNGAFGTGTRSGLVKASAVFALLAAIVVGLIGAVLFKNFVMAKADAPAKKVEDKAATRELTVAAINLTRCPIQKNQYKKILVTEKQFGDIMNKYNPTGARVMLYGDQPFGRVPDPERTAEAYRRYKVGSEYAILAEEPIFEDQLLDPKYPAFLSERLEPGQRAVEIEVPASRALIQVDDYVDILGTGSWLLPNKSNYTSTACFGCGKVIARFGTIYPECCPPDRTSPTRRFTVAVTPCQFSLIQLGQEMGIKFELAVGHRPKPSERPDESIKTGGLEFFKERDKKGCCTATLDDLSSLFQVPVWAPPPPPKSIELFDGTRYKSDVKWGGTVVEAKDATTAAKFVSPAKKTEGNSQADQLSTNRDNPPE
jgi:Flp pilus assembly protein CpaB